MATFKRILFAAFVLSGLFISLVSGDNEMMDDSNFTADFGLENCTFSTLGENPYFILKPGYQLALEGKEDGKDMRLEITILDETESISLEDIGNVETRVVEEREYEDDELIEVSRNFFAICNTTNDVYYFGEDVDMYENGEVVSHDGAWRAGKDGAKPGLMIPGTFLLGSRYFQEYAPGVAMDRAEHVEMGLTVITEAGTFLDCVRVMETTSLDPDDISYKVYCPGVGRIQDAELKLVEYGEVS